MAVTRDDVARRAGVSPATVSYVVNDGPRSVSPETRIRVLRAIEELGYQPSAVARSLRLQRTSTIGLIMPDTANPFFAEVARGVEEVGFENGYTVVLCHSNYDLNREMEYVNVLRYKRVDGVIFMPATDDSKPIQRLLDYGIPVVIVDRLVTVEGVGLVVADNFGGGYEATKHLIDLGHRCIGCIIRPAFLAHTTARLQGYKAALKERDLPCEEQYIVKGGFRFTDGEAAMHALLELDSPPTAVFAYNDIMAIGAMRAVQSRGLRVPDDVSIVGFDDISLALYCNPPLTTVAQPKMEMGRKGADLLIKMIRSSDNQANFSVTFDVKLVIRGSTGPVRKA